MSIYMLPKSDIDFSGSQNRGAQLHGLSRCTTAQAALRCVTHLTKSSSDQPGPPNNPQSHSIKHSSARRC